MALCRNAKGPLSRMLTTRPGVGFGQSYSTAATATPIYQSADDKTAFRYAFGVLSRRFCSQTPPAAAVQMSLIKQLRERTSAPIKDVKASLVQCNWDIGKRMDEREVGIIFFYFVIFMVLNLGCGGLIYLYM